MGQLGAQVATPQASPIIQQILQLESNSDPKCHATASRLEDFMYGTPLHCEARFLKNQLLKQWVTQSWQSADKLARQQKAESISSAQIEESLSKQPQLKQVAEGWKVGLSSGVVTISKRDKRQYSSIAYALRAILAVKQEQLFSSEANLLPLDKSAIATLKERADLYALAVLQQADLLARHNKSPEITKDHLATAWLKAGFEENSGNLTSGTATGTLLPSIIQQKLKAYQNYNQISNQIFARNIQVFFSKRRWPATAAEGNALKEFFATAVIQYTHDLYANAQALAEKRGEKIIREQDVHRAVQGFTPFEVDQFEDVTYFPKHSDTAITIEAYDMDAFRDSGLHWLYLKHAINESKGSLHFDADPFAAELLAESVAQFGVLTLRLAGKEAIKEKQDILASSHINQALKELQRRISAHSTTPEKTTENALLSSAEEQAKIEAGSYFKEVTKTAGINHQHRSSPWLSRLLRSYLDKGNGTGEITIPPAFGGAGIAAEDINNDGYPDLLILSGAGNKLYLNSGDKTFEDVTTTSGIDWKRPDGTYGEPRQPIIVDFNNDGLQDIFISYVDDKHRLYQNLGEGKFKDLTDTVQLGGLGQVAGPATVFDYDQDGLLDLYIGYFGNYLKGTLPTLARRNTNGDANQFFRNTGNFQFENVTTETRTGDSGWAQAIGHSDFDADGLQDLIVGNDFGVNIYYRNKGDGSFEDISAKMGTNKPSFTMGIGIADLNRDQHPDYYISNIVTMNKDQKYTLPSEQTEAKFDPEKLANMRVVEANDLFLSQKTSDGGMKYNLSKAVDRGYSSTGWSWDADFFDFDHDGDDDLYVLNGMNDFNIYSRENPFYTEPINNQAMTVDFAHGRSEKNVFFKNEQGRLNQDTERSGLGIEKNSRSATYLDYDLDGDLDIATSSYHGKIQLFENNIGSKNGNWLKLKLTGNIGTNRDAIGAKVLAQTKTDLIWKEVHSSTGYLSGHPKTLHVGIGGNSSATIQIQWPDNTVSMHHLTTVNQTHCIHK